MKCTTCEICNKIFDATKDNKLVGLVGTADSYACDDCLTDDSPKVTFADDSGNISDAKFIKE